MKKKLKRKIVAGLAVMCPMNQAAIASGDAEIAAKAGSCGALGHPVETGLCCEHCETHSLCSRIFGLLQLKTAWAIRGSDKSAIARAIKTCFGEDSNALIAWLNQPRKRTAPKAVRAKLKKHFPNVPPPHTHT